MENASKALVMAGGILIALMIIAVLVYMIQNVSDYYQNKDQLKEQDQIVEFNKEFESYEKTLMRGVDLITVINKANSYNKKVDGITEEAKIKVWVALIENDDTNKTVKPKSDPMSSDKLLNLFAASPEDKEEYKKLQAFKSAMFKCTKIGYDKVSLRVNEIRFDQINSKAIYNADK